MGVKVAPIDYSAFNFFGGGGYSFDPTPGSWQSFSETFAVDTSTDGWVAFTSRFTNRPYDAAYYKQQIAEISVCFS